MRSLIAWATRMGYHISLLVEKMYQPGSFPLTLIALGIVAAYLLFLLFISFL